MPASRIVQFVCPACGDLIELHNVDLNYIEVMIKDVAADLKQGRHSPCALEALKFALVAHLDPGSEVMVLQETTSQQVDRLLLEVSNEGSRDQRAQGSSDDEGEGEARAGA
jgi:hypothetical protein